MRKPEKSTTDNLISGVLGIALLIGIPVGLMALASFKPKPACSNNDIYSAVRQLTLTELTRFVFDVEPDRESSEWRSKYEYISGIVSLEIVNDLSDSEFREVISDRVRSNTLPVPTNLFATCFADVLVSGQYSHTLAFDTSYGYRNGTLSNIWFLEWFKLNPHIKSARILN